MRASRGYESRFGIALVRDKLTGALSSS